ncbi:hypothetical protein A5658_16070 [Mycobacterium sp. 1245111.1]|uniref:hypothetical protein n=1 Tax=Mycobacterium sp. 1245111.1 TaxID=1834073 RepID=UPI000800108F|nr:hypothetical protein [Mycobacterium sp. 1245111.1]OBK32551.1 hypothetical protein A5658_16070 [Mycobacterium sp. 1245111.1]
MDEFLELLRGGFGGHDVIVRHVDTIAVSPEVAAALQPPEPKDDVDALIASAGVEWPVRMATWSEASK